MRLWRYQGANALGVCPQNPLFVARAMNTLRKVIGIRKNLENETVENVMMFDFKDAFVVRATNPENNDFIITVGNRLATPKHYETQEEAQEAIKNRDWNLIATLAIEIAEKAIKNHMSNNKKNKK